MTKSATELAEQARQRQEAVVAEVQPPAAETPVRDPWPAKRAAFRARASQLTRPGSLIERYGGPRR